MGIEAAIIGGGLLAAGGAVGGSAIGAGAARGAAGAQLQATRESIAAQERGAERGFEIFQAEAERAREFLREQAGLARETLEPLREIGLENLRRAAGFADPDSAETQAERAAFQRTLAQNLAARGLTGSGAEVAGLRDFELGLARERRNIALGLAGQGAGALQSMASIQSGLGAGLAGTATGLGQTGASLFAGLGQNIGQSLQAGAAQAGQLNVLAGQTSAQGLVGATGALGGSLGNLASLGMQQSFLNRIFPQGGANSGGQFFGLFS